MSSFFVILNGKKISICKSARRNRAIIRVIFDETETLGLTTFHKLTHSMSCAISALNQNYVKYLSAFSPSITLTRIMITLFAFSFIPPANYFIKKLFNCKKLYHNLGLIVRNIFCYIPSLNISIQFLSECITNRNLMRISFHSFQFLIVFNKVASRRIKTECGESNHN